MRGKKQVYKKNIIRIMSLFLCVFPWITYLKVLVYNEAERTVFGHYDGMSADLFLCYKEYFLIGFSAFILLWFIGERVFPDKIDNNIPLFKGQNKILFICSAVFILMGIISTIFSENKKTALLGAPTEGEGLFTLICYVIIILAFYNYFANSYSVKLFSKTIIVLGTITLVLSLIEYFYKPIVEIDWIQKLIIPKEYFDMAIKAELETVEGMVTLSFYNPNYYGGFVCLLAPFILLKFVESKRIYEKILLGILNAGILFCVIASNSTASLYVYIIEYMAVSLLVIIKSNEKVKTAIKMLAVGVAIAILGAIVGLVSGTSILGVFKNDNSAVWDHVQNRFVIEEIELDDNELIISDAENELQISYAEEQIDFTDENGVKLNVKSEDNEFHFEDEPYENIVITLIINDDEAYDILAKLKIDAGYDDSVDFYILGDGTFSGIGQNNSIIKDIGDANTPDNLKKFYGMFTGRGYAWVNSLPILSKTLIKGMGPGNFVYYFKQHDYVGMLNTHSSTKYIIDKPHNLYLQYGINIGIIAVLAFVTIVVFSIINALRLFKKAKAVDENVSCTFMGGVTALIGFLIYSLVNDSIVTVTPIACVIIGMVLATGYMLKNGEAYVMKQ